MLSQSLLLWVRCRWMINHSSVMEPSNLLIHLMQRGMQKHSEKPWKDWVSLKQPESGLFVHKSWGQDSKGCSFVLRWTWTTSHKLIWQVIYFMFNYHLILFAKLLSCNFAGIYHKIYPSLFRFLNWCIFSRGWLRSWFPAKTNENATWNQLVNNRMSHHCQTKGVSLLFLCIFYLSDLPKTFLIF